MEGSSTKRRLSNGSGLLKICDEDGTEEDLNSVGTSVQEVSLYSFPKRGNSRRRSSIGGMKGKKSDVNPVEQARIMEMYKTVIQMSSENKITEKNSWSFDLIDHMGRLIKDENRGVNFQKASCTLDASVKIYSHRVDDTYTTSHRILESLSRNGGAAADYDDDNALDNGDDDDNSDDGADGEGGRNSRRKAKVGSKASSHRLNVAQTIERNPAMLNAVKLENDYFVDPMFHKISKAFDEGGAKGMLMNNLRLAPQSSSLSFHTAAATTAPPCPAPAGITPGIPTDTPDPLQPHQEGTESQQQDDDQQDSQITPSICAAADPTVVPDRARDRAPVCGDDFTDVDMPDLIARAGLVLSELADLELCPALDVYRERMAVGALTTDTLLQEYPALSYTAFPSSSSSSASAWLGSGNPAGPQAAGFAGASADGAADGGDDDWGAGDMGGDYGAGYDDLDETHVTSPTSQQQPQQKKEVRWSDEFEETDMQNIDSLSPIHPSSANARGVGMESAGVAETEADMQLLTQGLDSLKVSGEEEYSFFDTDSLFASSNNNAWAGAKHWKFAAKKRTQPIRAAKSGAATAASDESGTADTGQKEAATGTGKKTKRKADAKSSTAAAQIEFTLELVEESAFGEIKKSSSSAGADSALLSAAAQRKSEEGALSLYLPPDAKMQVKDLCRLYLAPTVMVPSSSLQLVALTKSVSSSTTAVAANVRSGTGTGSGANYRIEKLLSVDCAAEKVWGVQPNFVPSTALGASAVMFRSADQQPRQQIYPNATELGNDFDDGDGDGFGEDGGGAFEDDIFDDAGADFTASQATAAASHGLNIDQDQLLQVSRAVGKIDIGYAKVSKRVNIQRLKADIWADIRNNLGPASANNPSPKLAPAAGAMDTVSATDENSVNQQQGQQQPQQLGGQDMSFRSIIAQVSGSEHQQKDATLPFYFICLLHLANEHTLRIDGQEDMSDLAISMDK